MPRRLRFNLPGVPQHIVQRGNNRQTTVVADQDYGFYLGCLQEKNMDGARFLFQESAVKLIRLLQPAFTNPF
jgi:hypothetical protein